MSETYSIFCHTCCVGLWVGQAPNSEPFRLSLYGGNCASGRLPPERFSPLAEFLIMHQDHPLKFCSANSETEPEEDYLPLKAEPGLPLDEEEITFLLDRCEETDIERMRRAYAENARRPPTGDEE